MSFMEKQQPPSEASPSPAVPPKAALIAKQPESLIPIAFVRSALFSVAKDGPTRIRKQDEDNLASEIGPLGIEISCEGPHLNQEHFMAWQAVIHLGRANDGMAGTKFIVPANEVLRLMGKGYRDHDQRKLLWRRLEDLQGTRIFLKTHRSRYVGNLLDAAAQDDETRLVGIRLNPDLEKLLADESLENDMLRMVSLGRDQIAIWLHNYYASWGTYRNVSVQELHRMCGTNLDLRRFRYRLKKAGEKLMGGVRPFITSFRIDNDMVYVNKTRTKVKLLKEEDKAKSSGARHNAQHDAVMRAHASKAVVSL